MKTTKPIVTLLVLVLLTVALTHPVVAMVEPEISNTRTASCLIKVTVDEAVLPLNEFVVEDLLRSSGIAGKAAREVLEISPDIASELIEIEEISGVDSPLGGYRGYGGYDGYGGGAYGGYGGGMDLPADATPGVSIPGASTLGATPATRSARRTTPTAVARTPTSPTRTPTTRTSRPRIPTTTTARRTPTRPTRTVAQPLRSTTEQTILFRLHVDLSQTSADEPIKPAAEEFMMALIDNLRSALRGAFDQYRSKLDDQLELADKEASRAQHELVQMQAQLRDISDSRDLSRQAVLRDISSLRQRLQTAIMQQASDKSLYEATAQQIADEQARRKKLVEDDQITRELKLMLDVHEKRLKDTQKLYESGSASAADLEDVKMKIIRARVELAKRQEEVSNPPGGIRLGSLNIDLASLSTNMTQSQQQISSLQEQLKELEELLAKADDYELLSLKADIARQNLEETLLWQARLGRNIRAIQPPDVTVIGAE